MEVLALVDWMHEKAEESNALIDDLWLSEQVRVHASSLLVCCLALDTPSQVRPCNFQWAPGLDCIEPTDIF